MNYVQIWEKEHECETRLKEVQAISRRLRNTFTWAIHDIEYAGG